ncbi:MAG: TraR/DksA family transcriptional regulator [Pseudomonadota bacterium]
MTREEVADALGIVPNSVRGKVQKGQIERKVEDGKNYYRIAGQPVAEKDDASPKVVPRPTLPAPPDPPARPVTPPPPAEPSVPDAGKPPAPRSGAFNPKEVLLEQLASMKLERSIDAIEKGDEIDLATGEISRELDAKITMRQHRQVKEIQDALDRLKHGEYGSCEDCAEPIPEQRLRLFPAARLCVRCQEEADQYEKLRAAQGIRGGTWKDDSSDGGYSRSFDD